MPFIDEINAEPVYPAANNVVSLKSSASGGSHSLEDLDAMLEAYQRTGDGWHNTMLTVTASLVSRRWSEEAIRAKLGPYCWRGADDPDLTELIDSAQRKFGSKPVPTGLAAVLKSTQQEETEDEPAPEAKAPPYPAQEAPFQDKVNWLLATFGYERAEDRVVELFEPSNACRTKPSAFRDHFSDWHVVQVGPRGGQNIIAAAASWQLSPHRIRLAGIRMAPDKAFPLFTDEGKLFKNTYRRPLHEVRGNADVAPFLTFLERLIPDEHERNYQLDWMAHKWRHPEVPGCAILHLADNDRDDEGAHSGRQGTGRGILFWIARRLFGRQYCQEQDFRILDGSSAQSAYTDWLHDNVLVTCDESPSSPTHYRRSERALAYETLKRIIDPAASDRTFTGKYRQAFAGTSYCSIWIATNHVNALAIADDDRRITVLRNGRKPTRAEIDAIIAWRERPGSLAALAAFLAARDISGFNIHEAMETEAKAAMRANNITPVEEIMLDLMEDESRGLVFTRDVLLTAVRAALNQHDNLNGHFEDAWHRRVVPAVSTGQTQRKVRIGNGQKKLFCFKCNARNVEKFTENEARAEFDKWRPGSVLSI